MSFIVYLDNHGILQPDMIAQAFNSFDIFDDIVHIREWLYIIEATV